MWTIYIYWKLFLWSFSNQNIFKVIPQNCIAHPYRIHHFHLIINWPLPGHPLVLQVWDCKLLPWQSTPPLLGGGFVQVLKRVWTPPPHVTLHLPQTSHSDHPPLTKKKMWEWVDNFTRNTRAIVCKKQVIIIVFCCLFTALIKYTYGSHQETCSNVLYLDIHLCYKIETGSYPLGNPLHPFAGEGWCKYACDVALHCRSLGYSLPRVPNLTNCHLLRKKRKKS